MKIMREKDFIEIFAKLIMVQAQYKASVDYIEYLSRKIDDDDLRKEFKDHVDWCRQSDSPDKLNDIINEIHKRGVLNKGLRY